METEYSELPIRQKAPVDTGSLEIGKARDFALLAIAGPFTGNVNCCVISEGDGGIFQPGDEVIEFDLQLGLSQKVACDIRYTERMAVLFTKADEVLPWVFALRSSFPKVLHQFGMYFDRPACLCIYEESYDLLKLEWRPQRFMDDIRSWLELTSEGALHQDDQPLEPFFIFNEGRIVLPADLQNNAPIYIYLGNQQGNKVNLLASHQPNPQSLFHCLVLQGTPQEHGIIETSPKNLFDLHTFLLGSGIDLIANIRGIIEADVNVKALFNKRLLMVAQLPKSAAGQSRIEYDVYCFLTADDLKTIGINQNVITETPDKKEVGLVFPREDADPPKAKALGTCVLASYIGLSKDFALQYSGNNRYKNLQQTKICLVGTGSLGAELFMQMAKSGIGIWSLIDEDILLPHNLVRHPLDSNALLQPKAAALSANANALLHDGKFSTPIFANYFSKPDQADIDGALQDADLVIDCSTSIPLARHLAHRSDIKARKMSIFFNPLATALVILAEDAEGHYKLDELEFQYYRALTLDPALADHLAQPAHRRYSNSCRDITTLISPEYVGLLASVATGAVKKISGKDEPFIGIWSLDHASFAVEHTAFPVQNIQKSVLGGWTVCVDAYVMGLIFAARERKLPVETGGILIGGYDFERRTIYVVDTILSPKDSEEDRTTYVRGIDGVKEKLDEVALRTAEHLKYVGEWHSHPENCGLDRSDYDELLFAELEGEMGVAGYPPLMLIAGDGHHFQLYTELTRANALKIEQFE